MSDALQSSGGSLTKDYMRREHSGKQSQVSDSDVIRSDGVPILNETRKIRFNL
jgi:hypothetical protein